MTDERIFVYIDEQFQETVAEPLLVAAAQAALRACGRTGCSLSVLVVDDRVVQRYNRVYRNQDAATDVLSFAARDGPPLSSDIPDELAAELDAELGDLLLALPYASRQARKHGHSLAAELQLLVVHGTLHLLGYDHDTRARQAEMWRKQAEILNTLTSEDLSPRLTAPDW